MKPSDSGAATIYAAVVGLVFVLAGLAVAIQASTLVASAQAGVAADFGALAGAMRAAEGSDAACSRAADLAARNAAEVLSCHVEGLDLVLTVRVREATATARAGPVRDG